LLCWNPKNIQHSNSWERDLMKTKVDFKVMFGTSFLFENSKAG